MKNLFFPFVLGMLVSLAILTRILHLGRNSHGSFQSDKEFAKNAVEDEIFEVIFASLALGQGYSEHIRRFAKMLVSDHQKANNQLNELLERVGTPRATTGSSASAKIDYERNNQNV